MNRGQLSRAHAHCVRDHYAASSSCARCPANHSPKMPDKAGPLGAAPMAGDVGNIPCRSGSAGLASRCGGGSNGCSCVSVSGSDTKVYRQSMRGRRHYDSTTC